MNRSYFWRFAHLKGLAREPLEWEHVAGSVAGGGTLISLALRAPEEARPRAAKDGAMCTAAGARLEPGAGTGAGPRRSQLDRA